MFTFHDVRTRDLAASSAFYTGLFGWDVRSIDAGPVTLTMIMGTAGPVGGFTELGPDDERAPQWIPYVTVDDLDAASSRARELGATIYRERTELPEGSLSVLIEPGGALITLWENRVAP